MPTFRKRGKKWQAIIKYRKQVVRRTFDTKAIAERQAQEILRRMQSGENPDRNDPTLSEAIDKYMDEIAPLQSDSGKTRRDSNARTIKKYLGKYRLSLLNDELIQDQYLQTRLREVSPDTVRRELSLFSQVLQFSKIQTGLIQNVRKQFFQQRKLSPPNRRDRRLSQTEERRLLKHCSLVNPQLKLIVELVLQTGLRRGEVSLLSASQLQKNKLCLQTSKTGKGRVIPLNEKAQDILRQLLNTSPILSPQLISRYFKKACDDAGIIDLRFHDCRREAGHRMLEGKVYNRQLTIYEVSKILGHSLRTCEAHYLNSIEFEDLV